MSVPFPFLVFMICAAIGAYGLNEVMAYAAKARPGEPVRTVRNAAEGQILIWQAHAQRDLRRKFVLSQVIACTGAIFLVYGLWSDERFPEGFRKTLCVGVLTISLVRAAGLVLKAIRYGL